jgi:transcriptional regulator with GAF, ATPase, and Fis domain
MIDPETIGAVPQKAGFSERNLIQTALLSPDKQSAHDTLFQVLDRLSPYLGIQDLDVLFVSTTLDLSSLCFVLGQSFKRLFIYLQSALSVVERIGDRRSEALIKLHLGRIYYVGERRLDAIRFFAEGKEIVDELGDEDILIRSSELLGIYYHMQGLFREAREHFTRAADSYESESNHRPINPLAAMWLCYCEAYLGQFPRALGRLDYYRRIAMEKNDQNLATTLRAALGSILLTIKKPKEASFHFSIALNEAVRTGNAMARYFSLAGFAQVNLLENRPEKGRDMFAEALTQAAEAGLVKMYTSPHVLETVYDIHRLGLDPIPEFSFQRELIKVMNEPNLHLKGVALRLKAEDATTKTDWDEAAIQNDLDASEKHLIRCGDPIQLGKTLLAKTRLLLKQKNQEKARAMAQKAWESFSGYGDIFFPDDLRPLLDNHTHMLFLSSRDDFLNRFMEIIDELLPTSDIDQLLVRFISATNKFFGAERGGLFWFGKKPRAQKPILRAACNLTKLEVFSEGFKLNFGYIQKAFRENKPFVTRMTGGKTHGVKALICLPFEINGEPRGVLYHDNSFLDDCFDAFDADKLRLMANCLSRYIGRVWQYCEKIEKTALPELKSMIHIESFESSEIPTIITQSPVMEKVLAQADRMAKSGEAVLIMGETGVGKDLMALRLHQKSPVHGGPFVVVDMTTISENLIESELFGHEKGAFTGADQQKKGRIELAHNGTLFIDELGEIPKSIQVKLLRLLQNKTFMRVGGIRTLNSNFRLIAATNRDMAAEVAAGNFREDLYYRLNVLPLIIPPLRERPEDIALLARHFLNRCTVKHGFPAYDLTPAHETVLRGYHWPGNIRELVNVIERAALLSTEGHLELNLPGEKKSITGSIAADNPTMDELQRRYIQHILTKTNGRISGPGGAAEILGMERTTLYGRMQKLGIR